MVLFGRLAEGTGGAGPTGRMVLGDITNSHTGTGLGAQAIAATLPPVSAHASCTNAKTRAATIPAEYMKVSSRIQCPSLVPTLMQ